MSTLVLVLVVLLVAAIIVVGLVVMARVPSGGGTTAANRTLSQGTAADLQEGEPASPLRDRMGSFTKAAVFETLVIVSSYWYGLVCRQIQLGFDTPVSLVLQVLLALGLLLLTMGIAAVLLRPLSILLLVFALASLAFLLALGPTLGSGALALVFLLAAASYGRGVIEGMENYIGFSLRPVADSQSLVILVLVAAASVTFYLGYAPRMEAEGLVIPPSVIEGILKRGTTIPLPVAPGPQAEPPPEIREQLEQMSAEAAHQVSQQLQDALQPYTQLIAAGMALALFFTLLFSANMLAWLPLLVLRLIFAFFAISGVTRLVTETREVQRVALA